MNKELTIKAIKWSERMTDNEAEYLYSATSERYHKRITELYIKSQEKYWQTYDVYHPIFNPLSAKQRRHNKIQLTMILVELLLSN